MVTIKDVAREAKVSIATVSRILNNQAGYSEETKKRVMDVIEELSYKPNGVARSMVVRNTKTIGVLFPDVSSMLSSEILRGIEEVAHENDSSVIVCHTVSNGVRTNKYLKLLHEKRVDGLIFVSEVLTDEYYDMMQAMEIPIVLVSTQSYKHRLPYVKVDDKHASYTAVEHLIKQGHEKIGMISGNEKDPIAGIPRIEGFKEALQAHDLPFDEKYLVKARGFSAIDGKKQLPKLLEQAPDVTAIFAASDEIAIGAISALHERGMSVPRDMSIIGYDNLKTSEMMIPPLTTIAQPFVEMGATASGMLFEMLATKSNVIDSRIMPHELIVRDSVRVL